MSRTRDDRPSQAAMRMRRVRSLRKDGHRRLWLLVHVADLDHRHGPFADDDERVAKAEQLLDNAILQGSSLADYPDD